MGQLRTKPGFLLIEAVISAGVVAILITAFTSGFSLFQKAQLQATSRYRATLLAEEGLEAVRSIRDRSFALLVDGSHGIAQSAATWVLSGTSDTVNSFERSITISSVNATTKNVVSTITWLAGGRTQTYAIETRLTNWRLPTQTGTTTSLASSPNPSTYGTLVTLTATVTPIEATGTVEFFDGTTLLCASAVLDGAATCTVSNLAIGSHGLTAVYGGDTSYASSTSGVVSHSVTQNLAAIVLVSNPNPSVPSQTVTLTATVNPSSATGTVTFQDNGISIGTGTIISGVATITTSSLALGAHPLTAVYSGDINNSSSTSAVVNHIVQLITTTTVITSNQNPSTVGQLVVFSASIAPSAATGSVTFLDGATTLGVVTVSDGVAVFSTSTLSAGSHNITAVYSGNSSYATSTSEVLVQVVQSWSVPRTLATPASCSTGANVKTAVANNYAYIATAVPGPRLCTLNLTPLTAPTISATNNLSASPSNLAINGSWLYVSTDRNNGELQALSLTNPAIPGTNNLGDAPGNADATGVAILGTSAYITRLNSADTEFERFDISNPTALTRTAGLQIPANANDLVISGSYAYVASDNGAAEVYIINLTNPAVPTLQGSLNLSGTSAALTVTTIGSTLFIGRADGTLSLYSLTVPTTPSLVSSINLGGSVNDVVIKADGTLAFVATSNASSEFQVLSVASLVSPTVFGTANLPTAARGLGYDETGNYVVVVGDAGASQITILTP